MPSRLKNIYFFSSPSHLLSSQKDCLICVVLAYLTSSFPLLMMQVASKEGPRWFTSGLIAAHESSVDVRVFYYILTVTSAPPCAGTPFIRACRTIVVCKAMFKKAANVAFKGETRPDTTMSTHVMAMFGFNCLRAFSDTDIGRSSQILRACLDIVILCVARCNEMQQHVLRSWKSVQYKMLWDAIRHCQTGHVSILHGSLIWQDEACVFLLFIGQDSWQREQAPAAGLSKEIKYWKGLQARSCKVSHHAVLQFQGSKTAPSFNLTEIIARTCERTSRFLPFWLKHLEAILPGGSGAHSGRWRWWHSSGSVLGTIRSPSLGYILSEHERIQMYNMYTCAYGIPCCSISPIHCHAFLRFGGCQQFSRFYSQTKPTFWFARHAPQIHLLTALTSSNNMN